MIDKVVTEMKAKPFTMIMILGLYAACTFMWTGQAQYARAGEMQKLGDRVGNIEKSLIESQLRAVQSELFQLQQQVSDKQAKRQSVEQIYWDRINKLQQDKDSLDRKLASFK